jgi:hypothetical protein
MSVRGAAYWWVAIVLPNLAFAFAGFGDYVKSEFSPARGEVFDIPVKLDQKSTVAVRLYSADDDLVRTITVTEPLEEGAHNLRWDGKDDDGEIVPDEVYVPVLDVSTVAGATQVVDPRETSGGEVIEDLAVDITPNRQIAYSLPAPARVLVRAGIRGGPMMRSLANWEPRGAGMNVQRWDGMDESRVVDLRDEANLSVLVMAYRLPAHAIITTGNSALSYAEYRKLKHWPERLVDPAEMALIRNKVRIARQYYVSPARARDPQVNLRLFAGEEELVGVPTFMPGQRVRARVEIPEADRWLIDQSLYEVAFFVDHQFVSEEEQGYTPLTWLWTVDALQPGEHILTVNVSAFDGKVGVASRKFRIAK